jgi:hypothetical protein
MNPFTKYLSQWTNDDSFLSFVERWDRLERLVIGVYRGKMDLDMAEPEFQLIWPWLRSKYLAWEEILQPYWQATRAAGDHTRIDPFRLLLGIDSPKDIPGDWRLMQHLPAAREAINRYLVDKGESANG